MFRKFIYQRSVGLFWMAFCSIIFCGGFRLPTLRLFFPCFPLGFFFFPLRAWKLLVNYYVLFFFFWFLLMSNFVNSLFLPPRPYTPHLPRHHTCPLPTYLPLQEEYPTDQPNNSYARRSRRSRLLLLGVRVSF